MEDSGHKSDWTGTAVERVKSNGKRVFTTEFKRWIVEQARCPGASVAALGMAHGVNPNQVHRWMRLSHLGARTPVTAPLLLPVTLEATEPLVHAASPAPPPAGPAPIEIEVAGAVIRVRTGADAVTLGVVLKALCA